MSNREADGVSVSYSFISATVQFGLELSYHVYSYYGYILAHHEEVRIPNSLSSLSSGLKQFKGELRICIREDKIW